MESFSSWLENRARSPEEVFEDHLKLRRGSHEGVEEDLRRNFAENIVVKTNFGIFKGKDGVRRCASILERQLPCANYEYTKIVQGNTAYLEWKGRCEGARVEDGKDSFLIENGRIVAQNIYYTVTSTTGGGKIC